MNAQEVAKAFRDYAAGQPDLDGWDLRLGQCELEIAADMVIFDAKEQPLAGSGHFSTVALSIIVDTHSQDHTETEHDARVEKIRSIFFGDVPTQERTVRAAVIAAINTAGSVRIYNYAAGEDDPTHEQNRFRTPVNLVIGAGTV